MSLPVMFEIYPGTPINNHRVSVGLPRTGPSVAPTYKMDYGNDQRVGPTASADTINLFDTWLEHRFYNQLWINGGTA